MKKRTLLTVLLTLIATVCCVLGLAACTKDKTVSVTEVTVSEQTLTLTEDETKTLTATVSPADATDKTVSWSSSDDTVATVSANGTVTAVKEGTATITVTTADGNKTATCEVTVTAKQPVDTTVHVSGVTVSDKTLALTEGATKTLSATVSPENATDKTVVWTSSNNNVATVSASGVVTAVKAGKATITVKTNDGAKTATCEVTVTAKPPVDTTVHVTSVALSATTLTLKEEATQKLTATVSPENATDKTVSWSSSAPTIATVSTDGTVTAVKEGTATITVTTTDGAKTATCKVTVEAKTVVVLPDPETGSSKENATEAALDAVYEITLKSDAGYWFEFTPEETAIYKITVTKESVTTRYSFTGTLLDGEDTVAEESTSELTPGIVIQEELTADKTYNLYIESEAEDDNGVTVKFEKVELGSAKDVAKSVSINGKAQLTLKADQSYWFSFVLNKDTSVVVFAQSSVATEVELYSSSSQSALEPGTRDLKAGTYYVKVTAAAAGEVTVNFEEEGASANSAAVAQIDEQVSVTPKKGETYWFTFTTAVAGKYIISAACSASAHCEFTFDVLDSDEESVYTRTTQTLASTEQDFEANATYYVCLTTERKEINFNLKVEKVDLSGTDKENAKTATIGESYDVSFKTSGDYWFAITPESTGIVKITLNKTSTSYYGYSAVLLNGETEIGKAEVVEGYTTSVNLMKTLEEDVTYNLKVTSNGSSTFTVNFAVVAEGSSKDVATEADLDEEQPYGVTALESGKSYWFVFNAQALKTVTVTLEGDTDNLQTKFYNASSSSAVATGTDLNCVNAGKYYLEVKNDDTSAATFTVAFASVDYVPPVGASKDNPYEVTLDEAFTSAELSANTDYWFKLTLEEACTVNFVYAFVNSSGYIGGGEYTLFNSDNQPVKTGTASEKAFNNFEQELTAGTYYFKVYAEGNGKYTVEMEIAEEVVEPGSSKDAAAVAELNKTYNVTIKEKNTEYYWFVYTAKEAGILKITLSGSSNYAQKRTAVLIDAEENETSQTGSSVSLIKDTVKDEVYYLKVTSSYSNDSFTVKFETVEAGSSKDVAKTVTFGEADSLTLDAGKDCWYVFDVEEPSTVTVALGDGATADIKLALDGATEAGGATAKYLTAGTYYLKVSNNGTASATFTVTLTCEQLQEMPEGSTKEKAFEVAVSVTEYVSDEFNDDSEHWFTFTLDKAKTVTLKAVMTSWYLEINYALYSGDDETPIAQTPDTYEDGNVTVTRDLAAGTYYLKVVRKAGTTYTINMQAAPDGTSMEEAVTASIGESYQVNANEYWFAVKATSDGDVIIYSTGDCDTAIAMYWANGTAANISDDNSGDGLNFRLVRTVVSEGTYYFKVTASGEEPSFTVYFVTPGSTKEAAAVAEAGNTYSGSVNTSTQYWLVITPDKDIELKVSVSGSDYYNTTVYANVLDYTQDTARIGGGYGYANYSGFNFTVQLTADKTYYISFSVSSGYSTISLNAKLEATVKTPSGGGDTVEIPDDATLITLPNSNNPIENDGQEHWFKFTVSDDAWVYIYSMNNDSNLNQPSVAKYTLYDSNGTELATNTSSVLGRFLSGTYYLKVNFTGSNGCNLKFSFVDPTE